MLHVENPVWASIWVDDSGEMFDNDWTRIKMESAEMNCPEDVEIPRDNPEEYLAFVEKYAYPIKAGTMISGKVEEHFDGSDTSGMLPEDILTEPLFKCFNVLLAGDIYLEGTDRDLYIMSADGDFRFIRKDGVMENMYHSESGGGDW